MYRIMAGYYQTAVDKEYLEACQECFPSCVYAEKCKQYLKAYYCIAMGGSATLTTLN